jgi:hypothetical protein
MEEAIRYLFAGMGIGFAIASLIAIFCISRAYKKERKDK